MQILELRQSGAYELRNSSPLRTQREDGFSFLYKGIKLDCCYRLEIVVEDKVILFKWLLLLSVLPVRWGFSESTESNKKFILSVLCISAVNYYSKSSNCLRLVITGTEVCTLGQFRRTV